MIAWLIGGLVIGLGLLALGLIGRTAGDEPHCRACLFDLSGVDRTRPDARCSECGASLSTSRAVRTGLRKRRRGVVALGILILVLAISGGGVLAVGRARGVNWNTYKPAWMLLREARGGDAKAAAAAMKEFQSRLVTGTLPGAQSSEVVDLAIARQADPKATWSAAWGNFVETALSTGKLSPEQAKSYCRHAPALTFTARPQIAEGDPLPTRLTINAGRVGDRSPLRLSVRSEKWLLDGKDLGRNRAGGGITGTGLNGMSGLGSQVNIEAAPGAHTFTNRWKISVGLDERHPLAEWEEDFSAEFEVLPRGASTVVINEDESLRAAVTKSLRAEQNEVEAESEGKCRVSGYIYADSPPVAIAFDVYWRVEDAGGVHEWKFGSVNFAAKGGSAGYGYGGELPPGFAHTEVDVVLRATAKAAASTVDIFKIWGGEVVIRGVKVKVPQLEGTPERP